MRYLLPTLLLIALTTSLSAQDPAKSQLGRCGSPTGLDPWLIKYTEQPGDFATRSDDTLYVGLQLHLVGKDNGTGHFPAELLLDAFCRLNQDFAATGIQFYNKNPWHLINSTAWNKHTDIPQGIEMMLTNNVPDALNVYFVSDPAGNCGYNLPYAGIAIAHGCSFEDDHTWAHEVGHALSLPHPFLGWEGKTYNYATPTPETLTYDYTYFHDTVQTGPGPLDTALVERVNKSNCPVAADRFCDTEPDYLSYIWDCDDQNKSLVKMKDQDGLDFYADGSLFMSYAADKCQSRFSDDQIAAMRANLLSEKAAWLFTGPPEPQITAAAVPVSPIEGALAPTSGAVLHWAPVPGATGYIVQLSRLSSFVIKQLNEITTDTTFTLGILAPNAQYFWRVRPFNDWSACQDFSEPAKFLSAPVVATDAPDNDGWRCYPSLLRPGQAVVVEVPENWVGQQASVALFDVAGRQVWQSAQMLHSRRFELPPVATGWSPGLYRLVFSTASGLKTQALNIVGE